MEGGSDGKIALCFLTYGNLSQPKLWKNFINPKYNIYIHNKDKFTGEFEKYCIDDKVEKGSEVGVTVTFGGLFVAGG